MAIRIRKYETAHADTGTLAAASSPFLNRLALSFSLFGRSVKTSEIIFFTSQLSLMLEIGTPLTVALRAIAGQTGNPVFKEVLHTILRDIEEGRQLSEAMKRHPQVFNHVFISMVNAGETGGFLKKILDSLAEMQEKRQSLVTQLRSTLTYPAVLCVLAVAVVIFILVGILPKFASLFQGKESILPFTTRFLMFMSSSLRNYWWAYLIGTGGLLLGLKLLKDSSPGRELIDWFAVNVPMIARLSNKIYTCQLLRSLGHLMESNIPLIEALSVTYTIFGNRYYRQFINTIVDRVANGERFSQAFARSPYIMESVKQMVATGDEVGNLSKVMLRLAEFYDREVDRDLKILASMIEPLALIVLGAVVGVIVSSVILPVFKIAHTFR